MAATPTKPTTVVGNAHTYRNTVGQPPPLATTGLIATAGVSRGRGGVAALKPWSDMTIHCRQ